MAPQMKNFTVDGSEILSAVRWATKATNKDSPNVSIEIKESFLTVKAYNGIHSSEAKVLVDQQFEGELRFFANLPMLVDALKNMESKRVKFAFTERKLIITAPRMRFNIAVTVPRTQIQMPTFPPLFGTVNTANFMKLMGHCTVMTSDDLSTPSLTTIHVEVNPQDKTIKMMSTDRYRMVIRTIEYVPSKDAPLDKFSFDIDARSYKALVADLGHDADALNLYANSSNDNNLFGIGTSDRLASDLLKDVKAVAYDKFEKISIDTGFVVERKTLQSAINTTKSSISGVVKPGYLTITEKELKVSSKGQDLETEMEVDLVSQNISFPTVSEEDLAAGVEPKEYVVHVNFEYVASILKAGSSKFVRFCTNDPKRHLLVKEMADENTEEKGFFSLFMPISG